MFTAALLTMTRIWKQPKRPSADEWRSEMWYAHTMLYYSVIEIKEIVTFETTSMNLENTILSEISPS